MKPFELRLIFWETTVACNLECVHCRRLETGNLLSRDDLKTEEAERLIESLVRDFPVPPVLVLSGGEPLRRPDIFDITQFAVQRKVPVALATNGTLVDSAMARAIVLSGIRRVSISLDGARAQTHDSFRKIPGSFDRAVHGFRELRELGMPVQLNVTLTRNNFLELEDLYKLALDLGAESLHYFLLVPVGCGVEIKKEYQLTPEEYEDTLRKIHRQAEEGRIHIRPVCAPHYFRILAQEKSALLKRQAKPGMHQLSKGCLAGQGIVFISHKGEVFPCGYLPLSSGNIKDRSLQDIWSGSEIFHMLRNPDLLQGKCGICEFRKICSGCRARGYEEEHGILAEEPNCLYVPGEKLRKTRRDVSPNCSCEQGSSG